MSTTIERVSSDRAAAWRAAVETIIAADERDGELVSLQEVVDACGDDRCYMLLAVTGGETTGLLSAYRFPDLEAGGVLVYLYDIEVLSAYRRRGIARQLLDHLIELCNIDDVDLIWAGTEAANTPARRAFEATLAKLEGESYVEYEWDLED